MADQGWAPPTDFDSSTPNFARVYDYLLDGKDNFAVDQAIAEEALAVAPELRVMARENRAFLRRAVRFLAAEAGIRQFLDIGTGLPTQGNVHEVAQAVAPGARVVYVDADPVVVVHGRALLAGSDKVAIIQADLRRPEELLDDPQLRGLIDLTEPVAVLLVAVLHGITEAEDPVGIVARIRDAVAPGSYLVLSHSSAEGLAEVSARVGAVLGRAAPFVPRTRAQVLRFMEGFELVEPGLVQVPQWRPADAVANPEGAWIYGAVGRKI
ncbi:MAG TPA: SAM-dependent methyltransferase [Actinomycetota bacterium]|nr:SAM-dependent methyltransferase [Actinomycetota bacterium]